MAKICEVCGTGPYKNLAFHEKGAKHQANAASAVKDAPVVIVKALALPQDIQSIVDATNETPQARGRMVRVAFKARGWPNEEHPGTVRDFMEAHGIPCIYVPVRV